MNGLSYCPIPGLLAMITRTRLRRGRIANSEARIFVVAVVRVRFLRLRSPSPEAAFIFMARPHV